MATQQSIISDITIVHTRNVYTLLGVPIQLLEKFRAELKQYGGAENHSITRNNESDFIISFPVGKEQEYKSFKAALGIKE